jgi:hypothetical protein
MNIPILYRFIPILIFSASSGALLAYSQAQSLANLTGVQVLVPAPPDLADDHCLVQHGLA